jgi:hypothetical protein
MSRQDNQSAHEKWWRSIHPRIRDFFTTALVEQVDTSEHQNYIGAMAVALENQMLPIYALKGPGEVVLQQLITYAPPLYVQQVVKPTGIAGIGAGQIWNGGLQDNSEGTIV